MSDARPERHLDPDTTGSPMEALPGLGADAAHDGSVAVVVDAAAAGTSRGQLLAWATVNLLGRCFGALAHVRIRCPDHPLVAPLPTLNESAEPATTLQAALTALADALRDPTRDHPAITVVDSTAVALEGADAALLVGGQVLAEATVSPTWLLTASNWKFAVVSTAGAAVDPVVLPGLDEPGEVMVAAWFAATIGVGEAFKAMNAMRADAGRFVALLTGDLWNGVIGDGLDALAGPAGPTHRLTLPPHFVVGAGAVGQSYLTVLSSSGVDTDVAAVDDDVLDERNLNRHPIAGALDIGAGKAELAKQRLGNDRTRIVALMHKWQQWTRTHPDDKPPLPVALAQPSRTGQYGLVISAVDKNPARVAVAGTHPQLIFSGSTNGLSVEVGRYARDSPWQCLGCASPVTAERTIEQAAALLAGRPGFDIDAQAARAGVDADALRAYLAAPTCGTLGAREMEKFAAFTRPDWSVSFVSVAAGALLAARVLRHAHEGSRSGQLTARQWNERGDTVRLWMLKASVGRTTHRRRTDCPICHGLPTADVDAIGPGSDATW